MPLIDGSQLEIPLILTSGSQQLLYVDNNGVSGSFIGDGSRLTGISIDTSSFATTGSNQFNGNQYITGSLHVSGDIIGSQFLGTASYADTASVAPNYVLNSVTSSMSVLNSTYSISSSYAPFTIVGITAGGDLSGTYPNPNVSKINGNLIPTSSLGFLKNDGTGNLSWSTTTLVGITNTDSDLVSNNWAINLDGSSIWKGATQWKDNNDNVTAQINTDGSIYSTDLAGQGYAEVVNKSYLAFGSWYAGSATVAYAYNLGVFYDDGTNLSSNGTNRGISTPLWNITDSGKVTFDNGAITSNGYGALSLLNGNAGIGADGSVRGYDVATSVNTLQTTGTGDLYISDKITGNNTLITTGTGDFHIIDKATGNNTLYTSGNGDFNIRDKSTGNNTLSTSGNGDLYISDKITGVNTLNTSGNGDFNINDKVTGNTILYTNGNGDFHIYNKNTTLQTIGCDTFGNFTANSFITTGGTSSQFVKGDGSLDSNTYLTNGEVSGVYQPILISGTNIKTINSNSLLGSNDISVNTLIGYTPYNATNPSNYISLMQLSAGIGISYNNTTGVITSTITQYTDSLAKLAISSTITGLTYTNTTGVFSLTSGYTIPTIAEETNWNITYTNRINSLTTTGSGAATLVSNVLNIPNTTYTLPTATSLILGGVKPDGTSILNTAGVLSVTPTSVGAPSGSGNSTGTNTGDNATNTQYSGLVSNATHTGDATGATVLTLATVNANIGTFGTSTSVPIVTVNAKGLVTAISAIAIPIATTSITGLISSTDWNTFNNKQPAGAYLTTISGITAGGDLSGTYANPTILNAAVIGKVLTGYVSGTGIVAATDNILQAIQKLNGNVSALTTGVSSVFGRTGTIVATNGDYTTNQVTEVTNLYYTNVRSRLSLSFVAGSGAYNSTTGVITIPTNNNQIINGAGYLTVNQAVTVTATGDVTGTSTASGTAPSLPLTLATVNANIGTWNNVTVNEKGLVTAGSNIAYLTTAVTSIGGTANRITSTGGTTPIIDISAAYIGQSSITTLGIIGTGVWNGTSIANANLANSSITIGSTNISLGGTITTIIGLNSVTSTSFIGSLTGNSSTVTTNANLTGVITSIGNSTSITSKTGTGTNFVVDNTPTLITPILGVANATSLSITGTTGAGFIELLTQTTSPLAPFSGTRLYSNSNSKLTWRGSVNNYEKSFDGSTVTANRVYILPDVNGTVALVDGGQTFTSAIWNGSSITDTYISSSSTWNAKLTSPLTTKGDILAYSSTINTRLGVGNDGYVLIADSTQSIGLKWGIIPTQISSIVLTTSGLLHNTPTTFTNSGGAWTAIQTLASQTANTVLIAPNGSNGTPTFRTLVANDIPSLSSLYLPIIGGNLTGVGGLGYIGYTSQSSIPTTPTIGFKLYADNTGKFSWIGSNGFTRTFDGTSNTTNRVYTLPDRNITFDNITGITTTNLSSGFIKSNGSTIMVDTSSYQPLNTNLTSLSSLSNGTGFLTNNGSGTLTWGYNANLTATNNTLIFSGTYDGSTARTIGLNLANSNTWTGVQTFSPTVNASSGVGSGVPLYPTLIASANNDVLVGLDIATTFTNGAFSGVKNIGVRVNNGSLYVASNVPGGNGLQSAAISTNGGIYAAAFSQFVGGILVSGGFVNGGFQNNSITAKSTSALTNQLTGLFVQASTTATSGTTPVFASLQVTFPLNNTGHTITNAIGGSFSSGTVGANNAAISINSSTFTGNWSIYNSSANANYTAGRSLFGTTTDDGSTIVQVNGAISSTGLKLNLGSDATGDIHYRNLSGNLVRLGVGSDGQVLTLASGLPSWASASSQWTTSGNNIYYNTGNVSIGASTNLGPRLQIEGGSNGYSNPATTGTAIKGWATFYDVTSDQCMSFGTFATGYTGNWIQCSDIRDLSIKKPLALNPNGGTIGINSGINLPIYSLDVYNTASSDYAIRTMVGGTYKSGIAFGSIGGGQNVYGGVYFDNPNNNVTLAHNYSAGALTFQTNSIERGRFDINGNFNLGQATTSISLFQAYQPTTGIGTVSTSGTTVTGTGTQFTNTFKISDTFTLSAVLYTVSAISSDTSMTVSPSGTVGSPTAYTLTGGARFNVYGNGNITFGTASTMWYDARYNALNIGSSISQSTYKLYVNSPVYISNNLTFGDHTVNPVPIPTFIDLGGTYNSSSDPTLNLKLRMCYDGGSGTINYGIGVNSIGMNYLSPVHGFYTTAGSTNGSVLISPSTTNGSITLNGANAYMLSNGFSNSAGNNPKYQLYNSTTGIGLSASSIDYISSIFHHSFYVGVGGTSTKMMQMFTSTGNIIIQNGGTFSDDTINRLQINGRTKLAGQVTNGGSVPTIAVGAGAGTGGTASIVGTNNGGVISVTSGTLPSTGQVIVTITYTGSFPTGSSIILYPTNTATTLLSGTSMVFTTGSTTTFTITSGSVALAGATTYSWAYSVIGY